MTDNMTPEEREALEWADKVVTFDLDDRPPHESPGARVRVLAAEVRRLQAALPAEMPGCTIVFEECERGHGSLRGTNWVKKECPWCELARLRSAGGPDAVDSGDR